MNRTGLVIALAIGVVVGVVFGLWPQLDLAITRNFFDEARRVFPVQQSIAARHAREFFNYTVIALAAPAFIALALKLILPRRRMLIPSRATVFLIATLAIGPGLVTNLILKDNWGRSRPPTVTEFYGPDQFRAWWDPRGTCPNNCSFVAGEGSSAFWTIAPAALAPPAWRPIAYVAALLFGLGGGGLRLIGGAHFFSDVAFSGVFTFLIIWLVHGLLYRWRTRLTDEQVERAIGSITLPLSDALDRWRGKKTGEGS